MLQLYNLEVEWGIAHEPSTTKPLTRVCTKKQNGRVRARVAVVVSMELNANLATGKDEQPPSSSFLMGQSMMYHNGG